MVNDALVFLRKPLAADRAELAKFVLNGCGNHCQAVLDRALQVDRRRVWQIASRAAHLANGISLGDHLHYFSPTISSATWKRQISCWVMCLKISIDQQVKD